MTDELLRRNLQAIDSPMRPNPVFVEELHGRLAEDLGFTATSTVAGMPRAKVRSRVRHRGRVGWLAVAALLVLALVGLLLGQQGRTPEESLPRPSGSPDSQPTGTPSPVRSEAPAAQPSQSPSLGNLLSDGLVIFEVGDITEPARLRVLLPDLASVELLPNQPGLQRRATWRPDGSSLAFGLTDLADLRARTLIWETDAQGSEPRLLSEGCELPVCVEENDPGYSPDGSLLVFVRTRVAEDDQAPVSVLAIRDLESGSVTELEATSRTLNEGENYHPRWSPDGETIAYAVAAIGTEAATIGSTIRLVDADGANDRSLTPPELEAGDPEWKPDGSALLFSSQPIRVYAAENGRQPDSQMHLYTMRVDGSDVLQLPIDGQVGAASWTTSGEQILYTYMEAMGDISPGIPVLYVVDADGSNVRPVSSPIGTPAWYAVQQQLP